MKSILILVLSLVMANMARAESIAIVCHGILTGTEDKVESAKELSFVISHQSGDQKTGTFTGFGDVFPFTLAPSSTDDIKVLQIRQGEDKNADITLQPLKTVTGNGDADSSSADGGYARVTMQRLDKDLKPLDPAATGVFTCHKL